MEQDLSRRLKAALQDAGAGCSALSWTTEDGRHLWGRNFDFNRISPDSKITAVPRGTIYHTCIDDSQQAPLQETRQVSRYGAVGTGLLLLPASPILYEGINDQGLMGGQLYYRGFAHFPSQVRPDTVPLQPPLAVFHLLAQCATVAEVAQMLEQQVTLVAQPLMGTVPPLHWSFSDRTGETIVVESDQDGLHIYRNTVGVMTNSPGYPWHRLNLLNYAGIRDLDYDTLELGQVRLDQCFSGSGAQGLPGDWSSPSRFIRLAFLRHYGTKGKNEAEGVSRMLHLFQSAAFPLGMVRVSQPGKPSELEPEGLPFDYTVYTALMCSESLRFYWVSYENQRVRYVDLSCLAQAKAPVQFDLGRRPEFLDVTSGAAEQESAQR